jgi:hypothetical protein
LTPNSTKRMEKLLAIQDKRARKYQRKIPEYSSDEDMIQRQPRDNFWEESSQEEREADYLSKYLKSKNGGKHHVKLEKPKEGFYETSLLDILDEIDED